MRLASLLVDDRPVLAVRQDHRYLDLTAVDPTLGADVGALLASGPDWRLRADRAASQASALPTEGLRWRPVIPAPPKLLCMGLNDADHAAEAGLPVPEHPVVFARVASSLIGHREPMLRPVESTLLDYEVELAVVIGQAGRRIPIQDALAHVAGYTVFNDGSVRDFQVRTPQWTLGKNFHGTGALGPELVTADALPPGAVGLRLRTEVDGEVLQDGDTAAMIFDVPRTISLLSQVVAFEPGDVIAMGTPSGIGHARTPPRYLRAGQVCRVSVERVGVLENPVVDDPATAGASSSPRLLNRGAR
ncbi:MAG: fumarylacetoacetate hydrolase family protein [Alphaproteobacteria bacterium]|nr:fumarylacetoacetate hydrolase family protein [Alphaproteobacteria bacterium]